MKFLIHKFKFVKTTTVFFFILIILSCDDGDFNIPEFDFSNSTIESCGDVVLYKINENETLILEIKPVFEEEDKDDTFLTHLWENKSFAVASTGTNKITYRTLDENPTKDYYCQNIPPTSPKVTSEWIGTGNVVVNTEFTEDDEDTVEELNKELDTDLDGIPNYIDSDDDGDGILTKNEDPDGDGDPTNDDTDGDGTPNYLDEDDDNDGLDTKFESTEDTDGNDIVDYLDSNTQNALSEERPLKNSYKQIYKTTIKIQSLKLTNIGGNTINYVAYEFGTVDNPVIIEE